MLQVFCYAPFSCSIVSTPLYIIVSTSICRSRPGLFIRWRSSSLMDRRLNFLPDTLCLFLSWNCQWHQTHEWSSHTHAHTYTRTHTHSWVFRLPGTFYWVPSPTLDKKTSPGVLSYTWSKTVRQGQNIMKSTKSAWYDKSSHMLKFKFC